MEFLGTHTLRKLTCKYCKQYLSVGPIKVLNDGKSVCGRCSVKEYFHENRRFETILSQQLFPCSYDYLGCPQKLKWGNVLAHEGSCTYYRKTMKVSNPKGFPATTFETLRCDACKMYLNVTPINILSNGKIICGRCPAIYIENEERPPLRHLDMEAVIKELHFPCSFKNCTKKLTSCDGIMEHETYCNHRSILCPALPIGNCSWFGSLPFLYSHFKESHKGFLLKYQNSYKLLLTDDNESVRIIRSTDNRNISFNDFLLLTKVRVDENEIWICVKHLESFVSSKKYKFSVKFSCPTSRKEFSLTTCPVKPCQETHMLKSDSIFAPLRGVMELLGNPLTVDCTVNLVVISSCKWDGCQFISPENEMGLHEETCESRKLPCSWDGCQLQIEIPYLETHKIICQWRQLICMWDNCKASFTQDRIDSHQENCEFGDKADYKCRECSHRCKFPSLIKHLDKQHGMLRKSAIVECLMRLNEDETRWYMLLDNKLFKCKASYTSIFNTTSCVFDALYIGENPKINFSNYRVKVVIIDRNIKNASQIYTRDCSYSENFLLNKEFEVNPRDALLNYKYGDQILITFEIVKA